jgi:hypothetical protein
LTPVPTSRETPTSNVVASETPTPTETETPPAPATPDLSPTETPSATPSPTSEPQAGNLSPRPLAVTVRRGASHMLMVHYFDAPDPSARRSLATSDFEMEADGPLAAALGNVVGDGNNGLAVWKATGTQEGTGSMLEIYRLGTNAAPESLATRAVPVAHGWPADAAVLVGDIDPSSPADEIVLGGSGNRLRVFGRAADGVLRSLGTFSPEPRGAVSRGPVTFALAHAVPATERPGLQIVAGNARGRVYVFGLDHGRIARLALFKAFPGETTVSANRLAVGDLLPNHPGEEIAVADDGTRGDGLVRIFDGRTGRLLIEFEAFNHGEAPDGVQLWVGDVVSWLPGAELIVGQGRAGGLLRVLTMWSGVPVHVADVPDPLHRSSSLASYLAIGPLIPGLPDRQVAVAQPDGGVPVQVFDMNARNPQLWNSATVSDASETIGAIAVEP